MDSDKGNEGYQHIIDMEEEENSKLYFTESLKA